MAIKNPSDSHNYYDENHDEIEFYLGNSETNTCVTVFFYARCLFVILHN